MKKKQEKKIKFYSIYKENERQDLVNIFSVDNLDQLREFLKIKTSKKNLSCMISRHKKIDNQYLVYIDYILESEL